MELTAFAIADVLCLHRPTRDFTIRKIVTDSREAEDHTLFAALKGERADGHDFIEHLDQTYHNMLFLTERPMQIGQPCLVCENVLTALGNLAAFWLSGLPAKRIAVTGSVGKTTTKEMICWVLDGALRVQKSLANRNNELGMPLTAFTVDRTHQAAVFEMGMRGKGEIAYLAARVRPHIGVITNIGTSHIERLGSRENICDAKMELARYIAPDGVLFVNGDEPLLRQAAENAPCAVRFFGVDQPADFQATDLESTPAGVSFTLTYQEKRFAVRLPAAGLHNVYNALAAFATAIWMGVDPAHILRRLATYRDGGLRQHIYTEKGLTIFDDTYNASPESMRAALEVMAVYPNRKIAVLADMLELGDTAPNAHFEVGAFAKRKGVETLICYGDFAGYTARGFGGENCCVCTDRAEALERMLQTVRKDDMILVKGSHAMACGSLLSDFKKRWNEH